MITHLHIKNYKSLKDVEFSPGGLTVLVGPNAAGKSNFLDSLDFLGSCFRGGLNDAVSAKGGYENIAFRRARRARGGLEFKIGLQLPLPEWEPQNASAIATYGFSFRATQQAIGSDYVVTDEELCGRFHKGSKEIPFEFSRKRKHFSFPSETPFPEDFLRQAFNNTRLSGELLLDSRLGGVPPFYDVARFLSRIRTYHVSPSSTRLPGDPSGKKELGRSGENLPAAIRHLEKDDPKAFKELLAHLHSAASSFTKIETDYVETKQLGLFLKEKGVGRRWFAQDLSDGTLQMLALFVPLLDSRCSVVAIEEPENSLHPWALRDFIDTCRERSKTKQIFLTTHSPVLVSYLKPSELFLVDRQKGETRIFAATDVDQNVDKIINDGLMDLGTYWNSGQMSAVPGGPSLFDLVNGGDEDGG